MGITTQQFYLVLEQVSFSDLKLELTRPIKLTHYDLFAEAKVSADGSSLG